MNNIYDYVYLSEHNPFGRNIEDRMEARKARNKVVQIDMDERRN